jgi:Fe-S cluster assembly protein SufD
LGSAGALELPQFKGRPGWEFTDLSGLDLSAYAPAVDDGAGEIVGQPLFEAPEAPAQLPEGVIVMPIAQAAVEHGELVRRHLGTVVQADDIFSILNEQAEHRSGSFVYVPAGVALPEPISLRTVQSTPGTHLHQRTLIVLEEGAQAEVWEQYLSGADGLDGILNVVTELVVGDGSSALRLRPGSV